MEGIPSPSLRILLFFFCSIFPQFFSGLAGGTLSSKTDAKSRHTESSSGTGTKVAIICIAVAAVVLFSLFLFKLWQKKKREEQYARLLKLFEEDDELEVELGLRE